MQLTLLRKQILDYQIAKYRQELTPLQLNELEAQIRNSAATFLHSVTPSMTLQQCYDSTLLLQDGEFKINNKLYQILEKHKEQDTPAQSASELLLQARLRQIRDEDVRTTEQTETVEAEISALSSRAVCSSETTDEELLSEVAQAEATLLSKKQHLEQLVAELQALRERQLEIEQDLNKQKREAKVKCDHFALQNAAADEIADMLEGMVITYREIVGQRFNELLEERRQELTDEYSALESNDSKQEAKHSKEEVERRNATSDAPDFVTKIANIRNAFESAEAGIEEHGIDALEELQRLTNNDAHDAGKEIARTRTQQNSRPKSRERSIAFTLQRNRRIPQPPQQNKIDDVISSVTATAQANIVEETVQQTQPANPEMVNQYEVETTDSISELDVSQAVTQITAIPARKMAEYLLKQAEESKPIVDVEASKEQSKIEEARRKADERAREYALRLQEERKSEVGIKEQLLQERDERLQQFKLSRKEKPVDYKRVKFIEQPEFIDAFSGKKTQVEHKVERKRIPSSVTIPYSLSVKEQEKGDTFGILRQVEEEMFG